MTTDGSDGQNGEVTIVGQGAKLEGTVVSAGSLRIDGQVKGQVNADGDVMLSPQSQVEADIRAQNVSVAGRFKGSIVVKGRAEIEPRRSRRRQHHVQDARRRGGRDLPGTEHHGSAGRAGAERPGPGAGPAQPASKGDDKAVAEEARV